MTDRPFADSFVLLTRKKVFQTLTGLFLSFCPSSVPAVKYMCSAPHLAVNQKHHFLTDRLGSVAKWFSTMDFLSQVPTDDKRGFKEKKNAISLPVLKAIRVADTSFLYVSISIWLCQSKGYQFPIWANPHYKITGVITVAGISAKLIKVPLDAIHFDFEAQWQLWTSVIWFAAVGKWIMLFQGP